jgi:hypothetical protein
MGDSIWNAPFSTPTNRAGVRASRAIVHHEKY